jgi:hypothetical protein
MTRPRMCRIGESAPEQAFRAALRQNFRGQTARLELFADISGNLGVIYQVLFEMNCHELLPRLVGQHDAAQIVEIFRSEVNALLEESYSIP